LKERFQLLLHNHVCDWCKDYLRQIELLHQAAQQTDNQEDLYPKASLSSEAKERIRRSMRSK
jgi:hypothetical protein